MSFNDFLNGTEKGGSDPLSLGVAPNTDEDLFAEQDEDFGLFSSDHAVAKKVSKQKKSLFEEEEDEIDLSSLKTDDLLVSKFLTTETDTANGLISSNPMAENAGAPEDDGNRLAQEIGDDTALNDLEKVTQVTESAPLDLFAVENDKKDDLNILDMLENDMMPSTDNLDDIDAYIQSQSSGGSLACLIETFYVPVEYSSLVFSRRSVWVYHSFYLLIIY